jgi:hypothetical protein
MEWPKFNQIKRSKNNLFSGPQMITFCPAYRFMDGTVETSQSSERVTQKKSPQVAARHLNVTWVPVSFRNPLDLEHTSVGQRIDQMVRGIPKRFVKRRASSLADECSVVSPRSSHDPLVHSLSESLVQHFYRRESEQPARCEECEAVSYPPCLYAEDVNRNDCADPCE